MNKANFLSGHIEIFRDILDLEDLINLSQTCKTLNNTVNMDDTWMFICKKLKLPEPKKKAKKYKTYKSIYIKNLNKICKSCGIKYATMYCDTCANKKFESYKKNIPKIITHEPITFTKTDTQKFFKLVDEDLTGIPYDEYRNPYYSSMPSMKIFEINNIIYAVHRRYGTFEALVKHKRNTYNIDKYVKMFSLAKIAHKYLKDPETIASYIEEEITFAVALNLDEKYNKSVIILNKNNICYEDLREDYIRGQTTLKNTIEANRRRIMIDNNKITNKYLKESYLEESLSDKELLEIHELYYNDLIKKYLDCDKSFEYVSKRSKARKELDKNNVKDSYYRQRYINEKITLEEAIKLSNEKENNVAEKLRKSKIKYKKDSQRKREDAIKRMEAQITENKEISTEFRRNHMHNYDERKETLVCDCENLASGVCSMYLCGICCKDPLCRRHKRILF